jgi:hypothetical protein
VFIYLLVILVIGWQNNEEMWGSEAGDLKGHQWVIALGRSQMAE